MNILKKIIKDIIQSVDRYFLFRQYFFAILFSFFLLKSNGVDLGIFLFVIITTLLYPFSKISFDYIISFILGDQIIILSFPFSIIIHFLKFLFIYTFSLFIAPFSIIYILLKNKTFSKLND